MTEPNLTEHATVAVLALAQLAADSAELEADAGVLLQALRAEREVRRTLLDLYAAQARELQAARTTVVHLREELRRYTAAQATTRRAA